MRLHRNKAHVLAAALLAGLALTGAFADLGSADVVLIAPVGAGTTGGASMVPVSTPGGSGGSGGAVGGGAALYFETANLNRGLPWDAIPAADWTTWHRQTASAGGRLPARLANGGDASSIERRLVSSTCGRAPTTAGDCFLWANNCPDGARQVHRRSFDGPADRGQIACRASDWRRASKEFHSLASWGEQAHMDELSHWDVQIWREGESQPIFERRVALDASGRPLADADAAAGSEWWRSGGGLGSTSGATAGGPLGPWRDASDPEFQGCASRYRQAPRLIVGSFDVGGTPAKVAYRNGALGSKAPQVGGSTSECYWGGWSKGGRTWLPGASSRSTAPCATCFYEGIALTWQIPPPNSYHGGAVKAKFSYRLLGRPNTFYAIRIVSLDHREQLLMTNALQPKQHLYWSQYFRVFVPTGMAGFDYATPKCNCSG